MDMHLDQDTTETIFAFIANENASLNARMAAVLFVKTTVEQIYDVSYFTLEL